MRAFLTSARRVLIALLLIALVAGGLYYAIRTTGRVRQDRAYDKSLSAAAARAQARFDREGTYSGMSMKTWLCEKRAGMPVTEALLHLMAESGEVQTGWSASAADSLNGVHPPARWRNFHRLAILRGEQIVAMTHSVQAANDRAVVVAADARPWTDLGIAQALATDPLFRRHDAAAESARRDVEQLNDLMRRALPPRYRHSKAITAELVRFPDTGIFDFAEAYRRGTMPREEPRTARAAGAVPQAHTPPTQATSAAAKAVCATRRYDPEYSQDHPDETLGPATTAAATTP